VSTTFVCLHCHLISLSLSLPFFLFFLESMWVSPKLLFSFQSSALQSSRRKPTESFFQRQSTSIVSNLF
jgi:hypothetical protein